MSSLLRILLLVASMTAIAHGRIYMPTKSAKVLVTSSLTVSDAEGDDGGGEWPTNSGRNLLSVDDSIAVSAPSSVVQDWSLVCKQLCGAGLGGAPCASYCTAAGKQKDVEVQQTKANANALLNPNMILICRDLCRLQLGDVICRCSSIDEAATYPLNQPDRNGVCSSFCDHNSATLTGCSLCNDSMERAVSSDSTVGAVVLDAVVNVTEAATTTPNWNELCVALCKTGDGGALCKCDLSPFF